MRDTVRLMNGPDRSHGRMDLMTIGLLVFFVSLLVLVAALLFLPAVL
ncbi:hypothetical protein BH20CHL8_BH20CHL8_05220 [soil metagenome]